MVSTLTRTCGRCEIEKPATLEFFSKNPTNKTDGLYSVCKACRAKWRDKHRNGIYKQRAKAYRLRHAKNHRAASRKWYEENKERAKANHEKWCKNNREQRAITSRISARKRRQDPSKKIELNLRHRFRAFVVGPGKSRRLREAVGCTRDQLRAHLESQFKPGMSWENYGLDGWHIDHIRPCCSFDLTDPEQQKECFHYSNLQPLWASENMSKGGKWEAA